MATATSWTVSGSRIDTVGLFLFWRAIYILPGQLILCSRVPTHRATDFDPLDYINCSHQCLSWDTSLQNMAAENQTYFLFSHFC